MSLHFYLEKLHSSDEFRQFKKQNPDAFSCSGFFTINIEGSENANNKYHLDFYIPSGENKGKMFSFQLEDGVKLIPIEPHGTLEEEVPDEISLDFNFDFNDIKNIIFEEMDKKEIKNKVQKIILSLQNKNKKNFWICTVFLSGFGLLNIKIDDSKKKITGFEKKSFLDILGISGKK